MRLSAMKRARIFSRIRDNDLFMKACCLAERDDEMNAEIRMIEKKYIMQHLTMLIGEDEAERIMTEKGY